jgi:hypothetical protein
MGQMAAAMGQDLKAGWVQMVMADTTDWALCSGCATKLKGYLGPPPKTREFTGTTEEEARAAAAAAGIPPEKITELRLTGAVRSESLSGEGPDAEAARKAVRGRVPSTPSEVGEPGILAIGAKGEPDLAPKGGFLGIGKKPGRWNISWSTPFRARISFKSAAKVTLTYKE